MYIIYRVCIKYRETFHIMNIGQNIDRDTKIVVSLSPSVWMCVCPPLRPQITNCTLLTRWSVSVLKVFVTCGFEAYNL